MAFCLASPAAIARQGRAIRRGLAGVVDRCTFGLHVVASTVHRGEIGKAEA